MVALSLIVSSLHYFGTRLHLSNILAFSADVLYVDDKQTQTALTSSVKVLLVFLSFGLSTICGSFFLLLQILEALNDSH